MYLLGHPVNVIFLLRDTFKKTDLRNHVSGTECKEQGIYFQCSPYSYSRKSLLETYCSLKAVPGSSNQEQMCLQVKVKKQPKYKITLHMHTCKKCNCLIFSNQRIRVPPRNIVVFIFRDINFLAQYLFSTSLELVLKFGHSQSLPS